MQKCVIVGAGDCSAAFLEKKLTLGAGDLCIAADGGLVYLTAAGIAPDMVLGDMDSLAADSGLRGLEHAGISVKRLPVEKDDTDMLAAIKEGLARGYRSFELYGALGGRIDHTIANLQCLLYLLNRGARGVLVGEGVRIWLIRDEGFLFQAKDYAAGSRISVFAFGRDALGVTEKGLKYFLDDAVIQQEFPVGVSNEFMGVDAEIRVREGTLLLCAEDKN